MFVSSWICYILNVWHQIMARQQESLTRVLKQMQMKHASIHTLGGLGTKGRKITRPTVRKLIQSQTILPRWTFRRRSWAGTSMFWTVFHHPETEPDSQRIRLMYCSYFRLYINKHLVNPSSDCIQAEYELFVSQPAYKWLMKWSIIESSLILHWRHIPLSSDLLSNQ